MKSKILSFHNNSNIGLYIYANDKVVLVGKEVPEEHDKVLQEIFNVPIKRITIAGASFIRVFIAGNNEKLIVPGIIFKEELENLQKIGEELGFEVESFDTKQTCLGNNLVIGRTNVILNKEFSEAQAKQIGKIFGMPAQRINLKEMNALGSLIVLNRDKDVGLVGNDITDDDYDKIQDLIGYELTPSSVNMGSAYLSAGIVVNKNGFIIGKMSGGPEMANTEEGLGFLDEDDEDE